MTEAHTPKAAHLPPRIQRVNPVAFSLSFAVAAFVIWSMTTAGPSLDQLARGLPNIGNILSRMFPPDFERIDRILWSLFQTFQMAIAGCAIGLVLSVPLGILAAEGLSPHPAIRTAARSLIAVFRTVPDLVWALIFVAVFGPGPAAGTFAIAFRSIGFVGKLLAEAIEEAAPGPVEALEASGAPWGHRMLKGIWPQVQPAFWGIALFRWDINVRESAVLGLVGAGGIGVVLDDAINFFQWERVGTILLSILAVVVVAEILVTRIRTKLI
jgi:phosphonate transport system permease protein